MPPVNQIRAGSAFVEISANNQKLLKGLRQASARLKAFASTAKSIGTQLLTTGTVAAIPLALATKTFASFEQQMARVKALTGATADDFAKLEALAKKLGATTVFTASQAAEAMSFFALAGFSVEQIMDAIGPTLNLAAAGQIEIAQAADIAAKIMAGMGVKAQDLGYAVDVMAKAMTTANTDLAMLGDAFKFVGPLAKSAGVSLEEITAAIQLLSNAGVQGEMAGTTLRGMLLSLTSPSSEAKRELERLGVTVLDSAGNVRGLADIIGDMESALAGAGSGTRLESLGIIFPARQASGAAELVSQGADRLREATAALGTASGTASRIAEIQLDTLKGDAEILLSALEGLGISVGESLVVALRNSIKAITEIVSSLDAWVTQNQRTVLAIAGFVIAIGGAGAALIGLGLVLQVTAFAFAGLATAIGLIFSPIGLLVGLVVGLGTAFLTSTDIGGQALSWLGDRFVDLRNIATESMGAIGAAIGSGNFALAARVAWAGIKIVWQQGVNFLMGLWSGFKFWFQSIFTEAVFGTAKIINDGWASIEVAWIETVGFLADSWSIFTTMLTNTWHNTVGFIRKAWVRLRSLFDSDIDVEAEVRQINDETGTKIDSSNQALNDAVFDREQQRKQKLGAVEANRLAIETNLEDERQQANSNQSGNLLHEISKSEQELLDARREWQAAITEANQPVSESGSDPASSSQQRFQPELNRLNDAAEFLSADQLGGEGSETKGTFNALAAAQLGADSLADRTAKATEMTAKNTTELVKQGSRLRQPQFT